jgi:hypothetical protein
MTFGRWLNIAVKAGLLAAFVVAIAWPPDAVEGQEQAARAPLFLAAVIDSGLAHFSDAPVSALLPMPCCHCRFFSTPWATCWVLRPLSATGVLHFVAGYCS